MGVRNRDFPRSPKSAPDWPEGCAVSRVHAPGDGSSLGWHATSRSIRGQVGGLPNCSKSGLSDLERWGVTSTLHWKHKAVLIGSPRVSRRRGAPRGPSRAVRELGRGGWYAASFFRPFGHISGVGPGSWHRRPAPSARLLGVTFRGLYLPSPKSVDRSPGGWHTARTGSEGAWFGSCGCWRDQQRRRGFS